MPRLGILSKPQGVWPNWENTLALQWLCITTDPFKASFTIAISYRSECTKCDATRTTNDRFIIRRRGNEILLLTFPLWKKNIALSRNVSISNKQNIFLLNIDFYLNENYFYTIFMLTEHLSIASIHNCVEITRLYNIFHQLFLTYFFTSD